MQRFALAYFEWKLLQPDQQWIEDSPLLVFHLAGLDIQPLLDNWLEYRDDPNAIYSFVSMVSDLLLNGEIFTPFADAGILEKIKAWLSKEDIRNQFEVAIVKRMALDTETGDSASPYYQLVAVFLAIPAKHCKILSEVKTK